MKKFFLIFTAVFTMTILSFGQNQNEVLEEGKLLYRLEKASWYGTDLFLEILSHKRDNIGGYLSYINDKNQVTNIFFEKNNQFHIIVRFVFDKLPQQNPIMIDTLNHTATPTEKDLITIRQNTIREISENKDEFFTFYKNTSINPIPLINNGKRQVFILTTSTESNVLIIGNDYLFTYNKKNKLTKKEKVHNSLLEYPYKAEGPTYHSHVLSDLITSTDICTLLLYKDYVEWKQHYVISKKYISIFDLEKETLAVMTREAWEKILEHQKGKE